MASRGTSKLAAATGVRSWADVVTGGAARVSARAGAGAGGVTTGMAGAQWPRLGAGRLANAADVADWDVDSQLLARMEAREDLERGADDADDETFGVDAGGWSFEEPIGCEPAAV